MSRSSLAALILVFALTACETNQGGAFARVVRSTRDLVGGPAATGDIGDVVLGNDRIRVIIARRKPGQSILPVTGVIIDAATMRAGTGPENGRDALDGILPLGMVAGFDPDTEADVTVVADGSDGAEAVVRARARPRDLLRALEALGGDITPFSELVLETDYRLSPGDRHVVVRSRLINESTQFQPLDGEVLRRQLDMAGASATGEVDLLMGDALITGARSQNFVPTAVPDEDGELLPVGFDIESGHRLGRRSPPGLPGLPGMFTDMVAAVADGVSYGWAVRSDENNAVERSRLLYASTGNPIPADAPMVVSLAVEGAMAVHHTVLPDVLAPGGSFEFERYFLVGTGDVSTLRAELTRIRNQGTGVLSGEIVRDPGGGPVPDARLVVLDGAQRPFSSAKTDELGRFRIVLPEGAYFVRAIAPGAPPTALEASFSSGIDIQAGQGLYRRIALTAPAGVSVRVRDTTGRAIPAKVSVVGSYDPTGRSEPVSALINSLELGDERRATDLSERRSILARTNEYVEAVGWGGEEDVRLAVRPTDCDEVESCSTGARVGPYRIVVSRGPEYTIGEVSGVELIPGEIKSFEVTLRRTVDTEGYLAVDFDMKTHSSPDGVWSPAERARAAGAEGLEAYFAADTNRLGAASSEAQRAGVQTWIQGFDAIELTTLERGANIVLPMERNDIRESGLPDDSGCIAGSGADTLGFLVGRFECGLPQLFSRTRSLSSRDPAFSILLASHPRRGIQGQLNQMGVNGVGEAVIPVPLNDRWLGWPLSAGYRDGALSPVGLNLGDLDGMVVWHGKATPTLRDFRPPSADQLDPALSSDVLLDLRNYQCADGHPNNALGGVVFFEGGDIRYPGPLSDLERQLAIGRPMVAIGASGSGGPKQEPGAPRTWVWVGSDEDRGIVDRRPAAVTDADILNGVFQGRLLLSNGPFLDIRARTPNADGTDVILWPVGSFIRFAEAPPPGEGTQVGVIVRLRSPPWIDVDTVRILVNGEVVRTLEVSDANRTDGNAIDDEWLFPVDVVVTEDTFITAEAEGSTSLFPVVTPFEEPLGGIDAALSAAALAFGLPDVYGRGDGLRAPSPISEARPYAVTNPIILDVDASGAFRGPGVAPVAPTAPDVPCPPELQ